MNIIQCCIAILFTLVTFFVGFIHAADTTNLRYQSTERQRQQQQQQCSSWVSHINLWNAIDDKMGKQLWYTIADGKNYPTNPICRQRNNLEAVIACNNNVNTVKFYAIHNKTNMAFTTYSNTQKYFMFGKDEKKPPNKLNVLQGYWPSSGLYNVTITPYENNIPTKKINFLVTVKGDC